MAELISHVGHDTALLEIGATADDGGMEGMDAAKKEVKCRYRSLDFVDCAPVAEHEIAGRDIISFGKKARRPSA